MSFRFNTLRARLICSSGLAVVILLVVCIEFLRAFSHQEAVIQQIKHHQIVRLEKVGQILLGLSENQVRLSDLLAGAIDHKFDEEAVFERGRGAIDTIRAIVKNYGQLRRSFEDDSEALSAYTAAEGELAVYRTSLFSVVDICTVDIRLAPVEMLKASNSYVRITNYMNSVVDLTNVRVAAELDRMQSESKHASRYLLVSGSAALFVLIFGSVLFYRDMRRAEDARDRGKEQIQYLATHDGLTALPNRTMFNQMLEQSMKLARRNGRKCAVLFIDLDRFKIINDSLGHAIGDALLVEVANRLRNCIRESDLVARLGGDEFVIVLNDVFESEQIASIARNVLSCLVARLELAGHECRVTGSIGIAVFPDNGGDAQTLTKNADMAMYLAKEEGKNDFRFYSPEIRSQSVERLMLESSLRHALELNQFALHYQPKIEVATGQINGVEALLRWSHPDLGDLPPMKFIPLAEETGLIIPIGRWVMRTACAQNMAWQRQGLPVIAMAVNLSPRQFQDDNLLRDVDDVLKETGMPAHLLQLEITESMVMQNVSRAIKLLGEIQDRGVRLAIDDFGTGYSSMSLMKQFPIDTIKIDRSFVRDLAESPQDRAIATAIITMGKALGLTVVAEGVETTEQNTFLRGLLCDELQGYLFSKPVPPQDIPALIGPLVASPPLQPEFRSVKGQKHILDATACG
jgi:diguanylate cyclase (GGDEF)-like protein